MKIKQTIIRVSLFLCIVTGMTLMAVPYASAVDCVKAHDSAQCCGGAETSIITCDKGAGTGTTDNGVWALLLMTLNILTAAVGVAAVGGIAYGSALYASAADAPDRAKKGMEFIKNVVIGLVAYGLMFVILNFLIPGGIFSN